MIAEQYLYSKPKSEITINKEDVITCILNSFKTTTIFFNSYINKHVTKKPLNEDELTQVFVEQLDIQLRNLNYPFSVKNQYQDIYNNSPGRSDFYFHPIEEGKSTASIFSVESKRLPAPTTNREKEYVIGDKKNGGIERYKIERHGKGLSECGMIGFVEKEDFSNWLKTINNWIVQQSDNDKSWKKTEILNTFYEVKVDYSYTDSVAERIVENNLKLHHFWIKVIY